MKIEEAIKSLTNDEKQELANLANEKEIRSYLKQHNIEIEENYELSDDELDNVTGGLDIGYIMRILLKKFGVIEKGEEVIDSLFNNDPNKNDHNNTGIM